MYKESERFIAHNERLPYCPKLDPGESVGNETYQDIIEFVQLGIMNSLPNEKGPQKKAAT